MSATENEAPAPSAGIDPGAAAPGDTPPAKPAKPNGKNHPLKGKPEPSEIVFYSYPKFLYTWPVIFLGLVFPLLGEWVDPHFQGWVFLIVLLTVLMAMGFDLSRNLTISWGVTLVAGLFIILWLKDAKHVLVFGQLGTYLAAKTPRISGDWLYLFGIFGGILYLIMFIDAHINQRWRISHNEIEHFSMLSKDDALGRGAKRIMTSYPDFLELLLCGAGTIQIYSAQGGTLLRSIPNVPLLFLRAAAISRILEVTEVAASSDEDDYEHDEDSGAGEPSR